MTSPILGLMVVISSMRTRSERKSPRIAGHSEVGVFAASEPSVLPDAVAFITDEAKRRLSGKLRRLSIPDGQKV
jgi:hypothetical protein